MPRLKNSVPKYRKHRASGQAIVTLDGRDFYLGPHGSRTSRREYDRLVGEWQSNGRRLHSDGTLTVAEVMTHYLRFAREHYRKDGELTGEFDYLRAAFRPLRRLYGDTLAVDFGPRALKALQAQLIGEGLTRQGINARVLRVKRLFKWAASEELIPVSVHQALATVSGIRKGRTEAPESAPVLPVADDAVAETLPHLQSVVADMVRFQRLTGCRPGEVCILRPCDVDTTDDVWVYRPESHKTEHHDRDRVIIIGPKAQEILRPYLLRDKETCCFSPADSERKRRRHRHEQRVTPLEYGNRPGSRRAGKRQRPAGDRYTNDSYRRAIHRACDKAFPPADGLPAAEVKVWRSEQRWNPNQLRHTAATEIRKHFGLEACQVVLGHANADVSQVYAERDLSKAREIMREVG